MPIGPARMPLLDHLGELRMRLVRIVVVLLVACCIFYMASPTLISFLMLPIADMLPQGSDGQALLTTLDPFEGFIVRFKVSIWASVVATSPIILWQILAFFLPALKPKERKWFIPTFAAATALFIAGTVFCYLVTLAPAFEWLTGQSKEFAEFMARANTFVDVVINFELAFGLAFELPLVVFYLVIFNVIPYKKLRESWRVVYVALLVFSAMVTMDASPITMGLMFAALLVLYELSLLLARIALRKRIKKQMAEAGEDDEELNARLAQVEKR